MGQNWSRSSTRTRGQDGGRLRAEKRGCGSIDDDREGRARSSGEASKALADTAPTPKDNNIANSSCPCSCSCSCSCHHTLSFSFSFSLSISTLSSALFIPYLSAKMLKFWPSTPMDLTPRANPNGQERQNPFEAALAPQHQQQYANDNKDRRPQQQAATPTTPTTPSYHHQLLNTPHHLLSPSISAPTHASSGTDQNIPNRAPQSQPLLPHALASGPLTPSAISSAATALPTTSLSLHAPVFNMQQPPPPKHLSKSSSSTTTTTTSASTADTINWGQYHIITI